MPDEYKRGQEIGEIKSDVKNVLLLLENHIEKQAAFNETTNKRLGIIESWMQTTIGKMIILTSIAGFIGSLIYFGFSWFINHKYK